MQCRIRRYQLQLNFISLVCVRAKHITANIANNPKSEMVLHFRLRAYSESATRIGDADNDAWTPHN